MLFYFFSGCNLFPFLLSLVLKCLQLVPWVARYEQSSLSGHYVSISVVHTFAIEQKFNNIQSMDSTEFFNLDLFSPLISCSCLYSSFFFPVFVYSQPYPTSASHSSRSVGSWVSFLVASSCLWHPLSSNIGLSGIKRRASTSNPPRYTPKNEFGVNRGSGSFLELGCNGPGFGLVDEFQTCT